MSTFDGIIREFPGVRVDFFRNVVDDPPLACFLSHIHSDHIAGLDTFKGRLVYCSAATRAMLLKLQRKASRINFAQGILEAEEITYRHQRNRLKALPLNTPTDVELAPNITVRVTLFDANHCPGAVMFLFEGDGKAVLYTGDIRSETWHVDALLRNPCMVEYSIDRDSRRLKTLDKIYLDTSFTEDVQFQSKADGLRELLDKVAKYPEDTLFYFSAWTYGYEDVWIALAKALNTQIHVDDYKMKVYESLRVKLDNENNYLHLSPEAPALVGFPCGNRFHPGCLTRNPDVRIHSCEKGSGCPIMQKAATGNVVWITPIVAHLRNDDDMVEVGIGGGAGDLGASDQVFLATEDLRRWLERNDLHDNDCTNRQHQVIDLTLEETESSQDTATQDTRSQLLKRNFESFIEGSEPIQRAQSRDETTDEDNSYLLDSQETTISARALETRRTAFNSVLHESNPDRWDGLLCTTNNHTREESELGEERDLPVMDEVLSKEPES
ncbi:hypothetical protein SLS63_002897 [Diaporthe eres]|uniref:Metallo-beta-lactamase domain-containing protein n=1 Tax=Diaporthe eres TaxID=83184 RepID=A0ABR1PHS7_DIAER